MQTYTVIKTNGEKELRIRTFSTLSAAGECIERLNEQILLTPGYHYIIQVIAA